MKPASLLGSCLGLIAAVACNLILDNEPRYLASSEGGAGNGGAHDAAGGNSDRGGGEASAAGAPGAGGEGGAPVAAQGGAGGCGASCDEANVPTEALSLWFMADRGLTVEGGEVTAWVDQSAAQVRAVPLGATTRPKSVTLASGPPMVEFDGADDGLKLPEGFSSFNGSTFFAVAEAYTASGCAGILSFSNGNYIDDIEYGRHTPNLLYYEVKSEFVEGAANAFEANKRLLVAITQSSVGAVQLRINGVINNPSPKTIALPKVIVRKQNRLGRDVYEACPQAYKGLLGEVILFSRGVSADEYARIQAYLADKWSIPVSPP
jgi:hypothetical protein